MNVLANLAGATGAGIGRGDLRKGCSETKTLRFVDGLEAEVRAGLAVEIHRVDSGMLISNGLQVARLDESSENYIKGCIELGFLFSGSIRTVNEDGTSGVVSLRGLPRQ